MWWEDKVAFRRTAADFLSSYITALKWGRTLRDQSCVAHQPEPAAPVQVLENFLGHVDLIAGDQAYVTLRAPTGEILKGRYSAADLAKHGISEGNRFECSTVKLGRNEVRVTFRLLPSISASREAGVQVGKRFTFDWVDDNFREDY
jgi:hypothetical protein